jgi:hypothetical protein
MFDPLHHAAVHTAVAGRPYADLVAISHRLAETASSRIGSPINPDTLLIDAPPAEREIEFRLQVLERAAAGAAGPWAWTPLADRSPLVRSLAQEQFDDVVKRVRIFAPADQAAALATCPGLEELVLEAASGGTS